MSEVSCPLIADENPTVVATCGKPRKGVELRLVDAHDVEVAQGEIGELVIRTDQPWALNHGYNGNPEATAASWRNGWFHTGDAFRVDAEGNYFFVDRFKDAIRRRGENVSSFEVEVEVCAHPAVRERPPPSPSRANSVRTRSSSLSRSRKARASIRGAHRVPQAAHGPFHGAALRPHPRRPAEDADPQGREIPRPPVRHHPRHLDREKAGIAVRREKLTG